MSTEHSNNEQSTRGGEFRARFQRLRASRRSGMFGIAEIVAVSGSVLILLTVLLSYIYFLVPARSRLQSLQIEHARLESQVKTSETAMLQGLDARSIVENITLSLDDFEGRTLMNRNLGRMELYEELNQLIRNNGLRNTSGPSYTTLDVVGSKSSASTKSANSKWQSVYPGISVNLTVEGSYQNLRRFIRNIETSKQFIIINGIELERATETNTPSSVEGAPGAGAPGSLVSLRMDLATYFQRANGEGISGVQQ